MLNRVSLTAMLALALLVAAVDAKAQAKVQITVPQQPYQKAVNSAVWTNEGGSSFISFAGLIWSDIPADKVLVIEHVSARVRVNPGEKVNVLIACQGVSLPADHQVIMTSQGEFDGFERLVGSSPLRCYADSNLIVTFARNSTASLNVVAGTEFSLTGFLADRPK